jgi:flagellar assembly protein FliH
MMISPSDTGVWSGVQDTSVLSPPFVGERGGSSVVRLEFKSMAMPRSLPATDAAARSGEEAQAEPLEDSAAMERRVRLEEQRAAAESEAALAVARRQWRDELEAELEERIAAEREQVMRTCDEFRRERDAYFAAVEIQVVKLALAIAARVLQREVKLDPLLLQGVVKVALGMVVEGSGTVLRVPVQDVEAWRGLRESHESFAVEVSGDARLAAGECVLETRMGRVELGVSAQLEEVEKGFFDLMQQRPA